ncbi:DSBA-like thioredoxin domain-containing protein [Xylariaceae sp. FL1019]|nr:DSBA-like thioredoxin domain-containing protein [Xylariaceae sp. FL1019]
MTNFTIEITSDPVCPWCYIGKKRLDRAISLYQRVYPGGRDDTFTINWRAFFLDPNAPAKGISWDERHEQRFAARRAANPLDGKGNSDPNALRNRLASIGRAEGVVFSFAGKTGHTRPAHRAIWYAKTKGVQEEFVMALFADYFEGEGDVTSYESLADTAAKVGLDRGETLKWLESGKGTKEVDEDARSAVERGLKGVPNFTIEEQLVEGAQDEQAFMEVFVKIKEDEANAVPDGSVGSTIIT